MLNERSSMNGSVVIPMARLGGAATALPPGAFLEGRHDARNTPARHTTQPPRGARCSPPIQPRSSGYRHRLRRRRHSREAPPESKDYSNCATSVKSSTIYIIKTPTASAAGLAEPLGLSIRDHLIPKRWLRHGKSKKRPTVQHRSGRSPCNGHYSTYPRISIT